MEGFPRPPCTAGFSQRVSSSGWRNASKSHDIYLLCERRWGIILILIHHRVLVDHSLSARAQPWIWSCTAFIWVLGQKKTATQLHSMTIHSLFIFIFFAKINCIRLIDYYRVSWMRRGWESAALQAVCRSIYWKSVVSYSLSTTGALAFLLEPVMWFTIMHVLPHLSLTGHGCCGSGARNTEHEAGNTLRSMTGREACTPHTHLHLVHTHLHLIQMIIDSLFFLIFFWEGGRKPDHPEKTHSDVYIELKYTFCLQNRTVYKQNIEYKYIFLTHMWFFHRLSSTQLYRMSLYDKALRFPFTKN